MSGALRAHLSGQTREYEAECRVRHKDSSYRWRLARGVAVRDAEGRAIRFMMSSIDITELKRTSGGTVNLKLVLSNNGSEKLNLAGDWLGDTHVSRDSYRDISGVHLIDGANKKKYFVVTDSERSCVCSKNIEQVPAGEKVNLWAKFPAPPPEVTKVTIEIPHFQPIDDVPISQ